MPPGRGVAPLKPQALSEVRKSRAIAFAAAADNHKAMRLAFLAVAVMGLAAGYFFIFVFDGGFLAQWLSRSWREQKLMYLIVIAGANNIDNLGARIAYSIKGVKVHVALNAWISLITFVISSIAAFFGEALGGWAGALGPIVAAALLVCLGAWMIVDALIGAPAIAAAPVLRPQTGKGRGMRWKEATILGIALSINNIGGGLGAGVLGVNPFLLGGLSAAVSFLAFVIGNYAAEWLVSKGVTKKAAVAGGLLMIAIAFRQFSA